MAKFKMLPNGTVFEDLIESQTITPATSYTDLTDKPAINSVEIKGNRTSAQLGLMGKDEAYIKEEVDELIANIERGLTYKVVETLPTTGIDTRAIYLVPDEEDEGVMQQYLYISNDWVLLGSTEIDLDDYYNKDEVISLWESLDEAKLNASVTSAYEGYVMAVNEDGEIEPTNEYYTKDEISSLVTALYDQIYPIGAIAYGECPDVGIWQSFADDVKLYRHNIQVTSGTTGGSDEVRIYLDWVDTSDAAINTYAKFVASYKSNHNNWAMAGGWFVNNSLRCNVGRMTLSADDKLQVSGNACTTGAANQIYVADEASYSDTVKTIIAPTGKTAWRRQA